MKDINNTDFYFITDSKLTKKNVIDDVKSAIRAGVRIVQYREKNKPKEEKIQEAIQLKEICKDIIFLINNDVDVALDVDADGVHLGQDDMSYGEARKLLGDEKIIGLTIHNVEEAVEAEKLGADYVGVSPIFATTTKLDAGKPAGIELIERVKNAVKIPFVAIGGINFENADQVIAAGCKKLVAISAVIAKDDVEKEVKRFIDKLRK